MIILQKRALPIVLLSVLLFVSLTSCEEQDSEPPKVQVFSPLPGDTLYLGTEFNLRFEASDDVQITSALFSIFPSGGGSDAGVFSREFSREGYPDTLSVNLDILLPSDLAAGSYGFGVTADDGENTGGSSSTLLILPSP